MTGEFLIDTENLFRGFRLRPSSDREHAWHVNPESARIQVLIFGKEADREGEHVDRMQRVLTTVHSWFESSTHADAESFTSYGKRGDPGVVVLDQALATHAAFRYSGLDGNAFRAAWPEMRAALLEKGEEPRTVVFHIPVPHGKDQAENRLLKELRAALRQGRGRRARVIGSRDGRALSAVNDLQAEYPDETFWIVLPPHGITTVDKFGNGGLSSIPRERVWLLNQIYLSVRRSIRRLDAKRLAAWRSLQAELGRSRGARQRAERTRERELEEAHVDSVLGQLVAVDWHAIAATGGKRAQWAVKIPAEVAVANVDGVFAQLLGPGEAESFRAGRLPADRVSRLLGGAVLIELRRALRPSARAYAERVIATTPAMSLLDGARAVAIDWERD